MTTPETKAKYLGTIILQCTPLAELFLKDYQFQMEQQRISANQTAKFRIKNNLDLAQKLHNSLSAIESDFNKKLDEKQNDYFLEDVGFLHNLITTVYSVAGDSELRRAKVLKTIEKLYKDKKLVLS